MRFFRTPRPAGLLSAVALTAAALLTQPGCLLDRSGLRAGAPTGCFLTFDRVPGVVALVDGAGTGQGLFAAPESAWTLVETATEDDGNSVFELRLDTGEVRTVRMRGEDADRSLRVTGELADGAGTVLLARCQDRPGLFVSAPADPMAGVTSLWNAPLDEMPRLAGSWAPAVADPARPQMPVAGDWDGDGLDSPAVFDPAVRSFFSSNDADDVEGTQPGQVLRQTFVFPDVSSFLTAGDLLRPVAGDWDGDGTDTVGIFATRSQQFFLVNSLAPGATLSLRFAAGTPRTDDNLFPLAGDWNGDGTDTVGVYNAGAAGRLRLLAANADGAATLVTCDLAPGRRPAAGNWGGLAADGVALYEPAPASELNRGFQFFRLDPGAATPCAAVWSFGLGPDAAATGRQQLLPVVGRWFFPRGGA